MYIKSKMDKMRVTRGLLGLAILLTLSLILQACSPDTGELSVGDNAPTFTLPSASGTEVSLSDVNNDQPVLLYFHMALG